MRKILALVLLLINGYAFGDDWLYEQNEDPMTGKIDYYSSKTSTNTINLDFPYEGEQHAVLTLRYKNDSPEVILSIQKGQFVCGLDDCQVMVRFDDNEPTYFTASEPTSHDSNILFIKPAVSFTANVANSKRVRIAATIYNEGAPYFEFDNSGFDLKRYNPNLNLSSSNTTQESNPTPLSAITEKPPEVVNDTKPAKEETVDFPQPTWCKKAKKASEKLTCNDRDAARSSINLDDAWDNYQVLHTEEDIKKMRIYLRQQIKFTQACTDVACITKLNNESTEKLQKALKLFPKDLKTSYPFIGLKGFNFYGGTGTGRTISISPTGHTKIKGYSHDGVPNDEFEGKYEELAKEGYHIKGNKIYMLEGKDTFASCDAKNKDDTAPCVTELYSIYED